jgi:hypothetical protein
MDHMAQNAISFAHGALYPAPGLVLMTFDSGQVGSFRVARPDLRPLQARGPPAGRAHGAVPAVAVRLSLSFVCALA